VTLVTEVEIEAQEAKSHSQPAAEGRSDFIFLQFSNQL
jgi:hypothetical protein